MHRIIRSLPGRARLNEIAQSPTLRPALSSRLFGLVYVNVVVEGNIVYSVAEPLTFSIYEVCNGGRGVAKRVKENADAVTVKRGRGRPKKVSV